MSISFRGPVAIQAVLQSLKDGRPHAMSNIRKSLRSNRAHDFTGFRLDDALSEYCSAGWIETSQNPRKLTGRWSSSMPDSSNKRHVFILTEEGRAKLKELTAKTKEIKETKENTPTEVDQTTSKNLPLTEPTLPGSFQVDVDFGGIRPHYGFDIER